MWSSNQPHLIDPMNNASTFANNGYYIASGYTNTMYTLRKLRMEDQAGELVEVSGYMCKLAIDPAAAEARAKEITGFDLKVQGELNAWGTGGTTTYKGDGTNTLNLGAGSGKGYEINIKKPGAIVPSTIMYVGKYAGQEIGEIAKFDKKYLEWAYYSLSGNKFKCIEQALAEQLEDVILARMAEQKAYNEAEEAKLAAMLAKETNPNVLAVVGQKVKGDFTYTGYSERTENGTLFRFEDADGNILAIAGTVDYNSYGRIYILDYLGQKRIKVGVTYTITGTISNSVTVPGEWVNDTYDGRHLNLPAALLDAKTLKTAK